MIRGHLCRDHRPHFLKEILGSQPLASDGPRAFAVASREGKNGLEPYLFRTYDAPSEAEYDAEVAGERIGEAPGSVGGEAGDEGADAGAATPEAGSGGGGPPYATRRLPVLPGTNHAELWQAVMATSAAPLFFPRATFGGMRFADGGLVANDPTLIALREAATLWPSRALGLVVSLGVPTTRLRREAPRAAPAPQQPRACPRPRLDLASTSPRPRLDLASLPGRHRRPRRAERCRRRCRQRGERAPSSVGEIAPPGTQASERVLTPRDRVCGGPDGDGTCRGACQADRAGRALLPPAAAGEQGLHVHVHVPPAAAGEQGEPSPAARTRMARQGTARASTGTRATAARHRQHQRQPRRQPQRQRQNHYQRQGQH